MKDPYQMARRRKDKSISTIDMIKDVACVGALGTLIYFGVFSPGTAPKDVPEPSDPPSSRVYIIDRSELERKGPSSVTQRNDKAEGTTKPIKKVSEKPDQSYSVIDSITRWVGKIVDPEATQKVSSSSLECRVEDIMTRFSKDEAKYVGDYKAHILGRLPGEQDLEGYLKNLCEKEGIPYVLMKAQFDQESGFRQRDAEGKLIRSNAKPPAEGIAQLMPGTATYVNRIVFEGYATEDIPVFAEMKNLMGSYGEDLSDLFTMQNRLRMMISGADSKIKGAAKQIKRASEPTKASLRASVRQIRAQREEDRKRYKDIKSVIGRLEKADLELSRKRADYNLMKGMTYFRYCLKPEDGMTVTLEDHALAMARYHSGPGLVERHRGIPNGPYALQYVNVMNNAIKEDKGIYFVLPKDTIYNISRKTGFSRETIESLNPGLKKRLYQGHSFPIRLVDGADADAPLYSLRKIEKS